MSKGQIYSWTRRNRERQREKVVKHARLFHIRYGNLFLIAVGIMAGIWLIQNSEIFLSFIENKSLGYLSAFILGFFYTYGVTAPASIAGFFLLGKTLNPFFIAAIGSFGAMISNFLIYHFIKHKLLDQFDSLAKKFNVRMHLVRYKIERSNFLKNLMLVIAGFIIASPLPTEIAIGIFAAIKFDLKKFLLYAFIFQFVGIIIVSQIGKII